MLLYILVKLFLQIFCTGTASFQEQVIDNNISIGYGIALGDVDGDGKPDILLADKKQFVWYRNGDWKRFVMVDNLTGHDNVCIAAADITGDGMVEVAVGAQWNPGETSDAAQSGSVHYLVRPNDPTQLWQPVELHHETTIHRMKWVKFSDGKYYLVVVPLHGKDNKDGAGQGVKILAYQFPGDVRGSWKITALDTTLHLTHNFENVIAGDTRQNGLYVASKEGIKFIHRDISRATVAAKDIPGTGNSAGEVRAGYFASGKQLIATIEPMHGTAVVAYLRDDKATQRVVLDDKVKEGHALAVADFSGDGQPEIVAGWRSPDVNGEVGIKLYTCRDGEGKAWYPEWIDRNGMACEDLQVMDMNGDGKPDIVASGRATKNLKIYWKL
ncbi:MAG: FG-GAP repeat protein [Sphingobacteriales bacterium]|nr:FG-GAP repeat protein [Sphingobacteriales bacterium]